MRGARGHHWRRRKIARSARDASARSLPIPEFLSGENAIATRLSFGLFIDTFELHLLKRMPRHALLSPCTNGSGRTRASQKNNQARKTPWLKSITNIHRLRRRSVPSPRMNADAREPPRLPLASAALNFHLRLIVWTQRRGRVHRSSASRSSSKDVVRSVHIRPGSAVRFCE
jgi:hypothetical protein